MKKLKKEKKEFNKGYIPVIISSIVLLLLIIGLCVIALNEPESDPNVIVVNDDGSVGLSENDVGLNSSNISCDKKKYKSLAEKSNNIHINLTSTTVKSDEPVEDNSGLFDDYYEEYAAFDIEFVGIDKNIQIELTDDSGNVKEVITKKNSHYVTIITQHVVEYTVIVKGISDCDNDILRKFTFKTPIYNVLSTLAKCDDIESSECDELTYSEDLSVNDIIYVETKEQKGEVTEEENKSIVKYVVLVVFIILVIGCVIVVYVKHRKMVNSK